MASPNYGETYFFSFTSLNLTPRSQEGREVEVVLDIANYAITHGRPTPVLSAFTLTFAPGWLYLEAPSPAAVRTALNLVPFIRRGLDGYIQPHFVLPEERVRLLSMRDTYPFPSHDKVPFWARIQKPGRYHRDLALVVDVGQPELESRLSRVHVVPRLTYLSYTGARPNKRQRGVRPPPAPFNPILAEEAGMTVVPVEPLTEVSSEDKAFRALDDVYRHGLLELDHFPWGDLRCDNVSPLRHELEAFVLSLSPLARQVALATLSAHVIPLRPGDRIKVLVGPPSPRQGAVLESSEASVVVLLDETTTGVSISASHLRRVFKIGTTVRVVFGPLKGTLGFITRTNRADQAIQDLTANQAASTSRERSGAENQAEDDEIAVIMIIESLKEVSLNEFSSLSAT